MNCGEHRDKIAAEEGIIAFEMAGARVWENFPCVVIKGVSDYADGHKSNGWRDYAAATAAACMRGFLAQWVIAGELPPREGQRKYYYLVNLRHWSCCCNQNFTITP